MQVQTFSMIPCPHSSSAETNQMLLLFLRQVKLDICRPAVIVGEVWKADGFNVCMFTTGFLVVNPQHHHWPTQLTAQLRFTQTSIWKWCQCSSAPHILYLSVCESRVNPENMLLSSSLPLSHNKCRNGCCLFDCYWVLWPKNKESEISERGRGGGKAAHHTDWSLCFYSPCPL